MTDYSMMIGGTAGQGVQTVSETLSTILTRSGYYVFSVESYESRIRGGHTFTLLCVGGKQLLGARKSLDILVCLNEETYERHIHEVHPEGVVFGKVKDQPQRKDVRVFPIDFEGEALRLGNRIFANMVATGTVLAILGIPLQKAQEYLQEVFGKKSAEVVAKNEEALKRGAEIVTNFGLEGKYPLPLHDPTPRYLISGNEALGLGALLAGCTFYSAYPMTPSTGILNFLASRAQEYGLVIEQAEDEIAAINMAIGASYAGARAMTGTSGGGFCLMCEGLGLAAMTETPIVVVDAQRPGPSTGLPTRTAQGDLLFVIHASHDEFPRFIFAPRDPEEAVNIVIRAFNLAEKYQVPAIILSDQYLADTKWSYDVFSVQERPERPLLPNRVPKPYKRYALLPDGISPRLFPGDEHLVVADSDEHDEFGHLTEDLLTRKAMQEKRMKKLKLMRQEMRFPFFIPGKDATLLGWGSTWGVLLETRKELQKKGKEVGIVHFSDLYPLPQGLREFLAGLPVPVVVEHNFSGQLAMLLSRETLLSFPKRVCRYDGLPFLVEELTEKVEEVLFS